MTDGQRKSKVCRGVLLIGSGVIWILGILGLAVLFNYPAPPWEWNKDPIVFVSLCGGCPMAALFAFGILEIYAALE